MANKYAAADELLAKLTRYNDRLICASLRSGCDVLPAPLGNYVRFDDVKTLLYQSVDDARMNRDE